MVVITRKLNWAVTHELNPVLVSNFRRADCEGLRKYLQK